MNYTYGNNAYRYEQDYNEQIANERAMRRRAINMRSLRRYKTFVFILKLVVIALAATFMVAKYVSVDDTKNHIKDLQKELADSQKYTSEKTFELERTVSLTSIEEAASSRLDMGRPDKTQIIYVEVKKDDKIDLTSKDVEGAKNRINDCVKESSQKIKNIFTIK